MALDRIISGLFMIIATITCIAYGLRNHLAALLSCVMFTEFINIANISNNQRPHYGLGQLSKPTPLYYALSIIIPYNFYYVIWSMTTFELARILVTVWTTDTFSYILGSIIKGPSFSEYSPKKTWSGLIGGILFGTIVAYNINISMCVPFAVQIGDLLESIIKRNVNIKDSNYFIKIPGHGGILDRLDGLLGALICHQIITITNDHWSISI